MMNKEIREAAAIAAVLMLARLVETRCQQEPGMPLLPFGNFLRSGAARLLLVPTIDDQQADKLLEAMQTHRCDALVVRADSDGGMRFRVGLRATRPFISGSLWLWLGTGAAVHLVSDVRETLPSRWFASVCEPAKCRLGPTGRT